MNDEYQPPEDENRQRKVWTSLLVSGSVALSGCPSDTTAGKVGQDVADGGTVDINTLGDGHHIPDTPRPDAPTPDLTGPDPWVIPPDGYTTDGPACTLDGTVNPLTLEPESPSVPDGQPMVFWATSSVDLTGMMHELEVQLNDYSVLKSVEKTEPGKWKISVEPNWNFMGYQSYSVTAMLRVWCGDEIRLWERERYFCEGNGGNTIVVDELYSDECMMVCDPMPPPPDTECPAAFNGGVAMEPATTEIWGSQVLVVTARLDEAYQPSWHGPKFYADIGQILKTVVVSDHEVEIHWSRLNADCQENSDSHGKIWAEWPVECLDEPYETTGFIYAEINLCQGMQNDAYVVEEGKVCGALFEPAPPPACPESVIAVTADKDSFNIADSVSFHVVVDPSFIKDQADLKVEASIGEVFNLKRDCEAGHLDFSWKMPIKMPSANVDGDLKLTISIWCADADGSNGKKGYTEEIILCVQPNGTILVDPQSCSLFPLSVPVRAKIQPLVKRGLSLTLSCEHDLGGEEGVNYRWTTTGGQLSSIDGKRTIWVAPAKSGSYLIQSFAVLGDQGLGTDALTVNVHRGAVRSFQRV